jgi:membrane protease YdiL (CAAX protease family)
MSSFQSRVHWIFVGPNGIRAGWRLFVATALFWGLLVSLQAGLMRIPAVHAWVDRSSTEAVTPALIFFSEGPSVLCLMLSVWVMALIERRSFADYGLPGNEVFGKRFWQGVPYGLAMLTLLMALIEVFHGFSLDGVALRAGEAVRYGFLYFLGFILVAIFEDFSFRGYMQATLASGVGFWPAAILLGIFFGAPHLANSGESQWGALMAGAFGLLEAFSLRRTGNLWFAIGLHASWDWGETYLYSVPDSGLLAQGHLLNASFHGPKWLTGGSVGPEGSALVLPVLMLSALAIHYIFPAKPKSL